jgi:transcription termination factor NusB
MRFQRQQNARMFFVQWLFANYYRGVEVQEAFEVFSFTEENFDYPLFYKLEQTYENSREFIKSLTNPQTDVINECILSLGICEMLNGTDSALAISECLNICDLFCNNSRYINGALERIKLLILQNKNVV